MSKPIVAIVGRPNVGKSMLFNKLTGKRMAIVEDTPGVTRDRIYGECEWNGRGFALVDTGGIEPGTNNEMLKFMRRQAEIAIETATVIIMVVDVTVGLTAADAEVASMLKRSKKPVVLAVNKCDQTGHANPEAYEFYALGLGDPIEVSAVHGHGTGDLLDACVASFPPDDGEEYDEDVIKVAIIGKPNVGKSSLLNKILGEERVIVSNIAGTTRDAIDTHFMDEGKEYVLIDTAGIRRKRAIAYQSLERFSVVRSLAAIDRANVVLFLIDATQGVTEQDTKIAGYVDEQGKAAIIVVNKWDAVEKQTGTLEEFTRKIRTELKFMDYAPVLFLSALTGQRVHKLMGMVRAVHEQATRRITTGLLNDVLADAQNALQPPSMSGRRLRIYYATQASVAPPTFVLFVNDETLMHFSYERYLNNAFRKAFGFEGTPIRFILRERGKEQ